MDLISMFVGAAIVIVLIWAIFMLSDAFNWLKERWNKQIEQSKELNHVLKKIVEELTKLNFKRNW